MPDLDIPNLKSENKLDFSNRIEGYLSGKSIEKNFKVKFKKDLTAKEIFSKYRNKEVLHDANFQRITRLSIKVIKNLKTNAINM